MSKKTSHLVAKGARFYFRMRVPADLVGSIGKTEVTQALGDVSRSQAAVAASQLAAQWSAHFLAEQHRLGLSVNAPAAEAIASIPDREPTATELRAIAQLAAQTVLEVDMETRIEGTPTGALELPEFGPGKPLGESLQGTISGRDMSGMQPRADEWLGSYGLTLPADPVSRRRMLMTWAMEMAKARKGQLLRDQGEPVETPERPALPSSLQPPSEPLKANEKPADELTLRDVLELWKTDVRSRPLKTMQKAAQTVTKFEALTGNPPLGKLTKAMGAEFRSALLAGDMSEKTARDHLSWVHILLNFEVARYGRISANPWKGLTVKVKKSAIREEWKDADAAKLFALPVFQRYELPADRNAGLDAAYWLPIIGAFTGARITEIAQLLVADIQFELGQWFIRFEVTEPWQSLKRDSSRRTIPMHSELVRLGLPEYAKAMHEAKESRLFPAVTVSELNNAGGGPSKWFSALKIAAGFGPANTFHGWRNTVETKLQRAREGQLFIDRYIGHQPSGGEGPETYARIAPADLIETAEKVTYEGFKLPRVYPAR